MDLKLRITLEPNAANGRSCKESHRDIRVAVASNHTFKSVTSPTPPHPESSKPKQKQSMISNPKTHPSGSGVMDTSFAHNSLLVAGAHVRRQIEGAQGTLALVINTNPAHELSLCAALSGGGRKGTSHIADIYDDTTEIAYSIHEESARTTSVRFRQLADILDPTTGSLLSRLERYEVALTLALAKLRFHSTPWLADQLKGDRIQVLQSDTGSLETEAAFLIAKLGRTPAGVTSAVLHKESFEDLAISLLDLCFGKRLLLGVPTECAAVSRLLEPLER